MLNYQRVIYIYIYIYILSIYLYVYIYMCMYIYICMQYVLGKWLVMSTSMFIYGRIQIDMSLQRSLFIYIPCFWAPVKLVKIYQKTYRISWNFMGFHGISPCKENSNSSCTTFRPVALETVWHFLQFVEHFSDHGEQLVFGNVGPANAGTEEEQPSRHSTLP